MQRIIRCCVLVMLGWLLTPYHTYSITYSEELLKKLNLNQMRALLEKAGKNNDAQLINQLGHHVQELEQQEGVLVKGVRKGDIFIRDAQGALKNLEGQELERAKQELQPLPRGVPVPATPPAGFSAADGNWQWLAKGQKVVWVSQQAGTMVGNIFQSGAAAPQRTNEQQTIQELRATVEKLQSELALANKYERGDIIPLSPTGIPVGVSQAVQEELRIRITELPRGMHAPALPAGFTHDDGFWAWDPVALQAVWVLKKPGEFSRGTFQATGPAQERQPRAPEEAQPVEAVPAAPPTGEEIPAAPPVEQEGIPMAPSLEEEGVPMAPPMDEGDVPPPPPIDGPEGIPAPEIEKPKKPVGPLPALSQQEMDELSKEQKEVSDRIFLTLLERLVHQNPPLARFDAREYIDIIRGATKPEPSGLEQLRYNQSLNFLKRKELGDLINKRKGALDQLLNPKNADIECIKTLNFNAVDDFGEQEQKIADTVKAAAACCVPLFAMCLFDSERNHAQLVSSVEWFVVTIMGLHRVINTRPTETDKIQSNALVEALLTSPDIENEKVTPSLFVQQLRELILNKLFIKPEVLLRNPMTSEEQQSFLKVVEKMSAVSMLMTPSVARASNQRFIAPAVERDLFARPRENVQRFLDEVMPMINTALTHIFAAGARAAKAAGPAVPEAFDINAYIQKELPKVMTLAGLRKMIASMPSAALSPEAKKMLTLFVDMVKEVPDLFVASQAYDVLMTAQDVTELLARLSIVNETQPLIKAWLKNISQWPKEDKSSWMPLQNLSENVIAELRKKVQDLVFNAKTALSFIYMFRDNIAMMRKAAAQGKSTEMSGELVIALNSLIQQYSTSDNPLTWKVVKASTGFDIERISSIINLIKDIHRTPDALFKEINAFIPQSVSSLEDLKLRKDDIVMMIQDYNLFLTVLNKITTYDEAIESLRSLNNGKAAELKDIDYNTATRYEGKLKAVVDALLAKNFAAVRTALKDFVMRAGVGFEKNKEFKQGLSTILNLLQADIRVELIMPLRALNEGNAVNIPGLEAARNKLNIAFLNALKGTLKELLSVLTTLKNVKDFNLETYLNAVYSYARVDGVLGTVLTSLPDNLFEKGKRVQQEQQLRMNLITHLVSIGANFEKFKQVVAGKKPAMTVEEIERMVQEPLQQAGIESSDIVKPLIITMSALLKNKDIIVQTIVQHARAVQALHKDIDQAIAQNQPLSYMQKLYASYDALLNPYTADPALQAMTP